MDLDFIKQTPWSDAESQLAMQFDMTIRPMCDRSAELTAGDISASGFRTEDIVSSFSNNPAEVTEFGARWYADCMGHDYGEEWNPEEGDQQEGSGDIKTVGIGQGFLVKYTLLYMYAKDKPSELQDLIKRLRIPHAPKVAKDVMRIFNDVN